jgi:hypothetical protein
MAACFCVAGKDPEGSTSKVMLPTIAGNSAQNRADKDGIIETLQTRIV